MTAPWRALHAAFLGWMLDGMDVMLYAFALTSLQKEFGLSPAALGGVASATLVTSAIGGIAAGALADRFGRARVLSWSILVYSLTTAGTATAQGLASLLVWRALVGFGLGAEWSAGSVLVAETWPAHRRGAAIGFVQSGWAIGYLAAAGLSALLLPTHGWRVLFLAGVFPALLTVWIRRRVEEPEAWRLRRDAATKGARATDVAAASGAHPGGDAVLTAAERFRIILRPPLRRYTLVATGMGAALLFAYWGLFTWIPAYLSSPLERGGAGLGLVKSAAWIAPMQIGAFLGYNLFGLVADRIGRRPAFLFFVLGAAAIVPAYGLASRQPAMLLALGPLVGFFGHGYFSLFGAMLAELFPAGVRATAQGLCYNTGRAISALAPFGIGAAADRFGFGVALALTSMLYLVGGALIFLLPETRGRELA
ncbi:MAG TPA: MFS transporter [Candidatus Polarisedimenticolia bacterium]|jgi:MFS family permease|nr:MFS transporter [Candidatus Polarisedimenticolia bacterium]